MFGIGKEAGDAAGGVVKGVIDGVGSTLDTLFTSDEERGKIEIALKELENAPFMQSLKVLAQEASHASVFVAGARPALLWSCVGGVLYEGVLRGIMMWMQNWIVIIVGYTGTVPELPSIESVFFELIGLAAALYGVRGVESIKGVARKRIRGPKI